MQAVNNYIGVVNPSSHLMWRRCWRYDVSITCTYVPTYANTLALHLYVRLLLLITLSPRVTLVTFDYAGDDPQHENVHPWISSRNDKEVKDSDACKDYHHRYKSNVNNSNVIINVTNCMFSIN